MFVYIRACFRFALIGGNLTAQSMGSHRGIGGGIQLPETYWFLTLLARAPRRACLQASISLMWNMCVVSWVLISRRNVSQVSSSLYQSKSWSWKSVYDSWFQSKLFEGRYSSLISNCFCHVTFPWWTQLWRTAKLFVPHPNKLYSPPSCGARRWLVEIALLQLHLPSCVARQLLCQEVMIQGHPTTASSQFCTLSRVLLDLYKCILSGAIKFVFVRSS